MLSQEVPAQPRDPNHPQQQSESASNECPVRVSPLVAENIEVAQKTELGVDGAAAGEVRGDLLEDAEDGNGDAGVDEEEEDDDGGEAPAAGQGALGKVLESPEE